MSNVVTEGRPEDEPAVVELVSPYGYRIDGSPPPVAYVPLTHQEPGQVGSDEWRDVTPEAYRGSGQPVGPELWRRVQEAADTPEGRRVLASILQTDRQFPEEGRIYEVTIGGQTDATTGNATLRLFEVPQGLVAKVVRVVVESAAFSPASPFSTANAWHAIVSAPTGTQIAPANVWGSGMVRDFGPVSAGGPLIPALFTDNDDQAGVGRSGRTIWYVLNGASAAAILNKQLAVTVRLNVLAVS